ncbi:uncharacterized protein cd8b [Synchiropus splendidus]|uniref:uncharacterized protein cd8b n=1 Tax=Synchiropus splendidus TaxID=270530 RepID=UPI00237D46C2|nr:uncharacterized protein cd8b [Synchiropus splendidus]
MTLPPLIWTLILMWMPVPSQAQGQDPPHVLYPEILSSVSIECDGSKNSDSVYWFHTSTHQRRVQFLVKSNNANRGSYGDKVDKSRYKINKRGSAFTLRIINVTEDDAGVYSCVLKDLQNEEVWRPGGTLLRPGVDPPVPTTLPKPKPEVKKDKCKCEQPKSPGGCSSLILNVLVALLSVLTLAIIGTLYYFSRLPKKCRHHFVKKKFGS